MPKPDERFDWDLTDEEYEADPAVLGFYGLNPEAEEDDFDGEALIDNLLSGDLDG
jgi:hypothetical protein